MPPKDQNDQAPDEKGSVPQPSGDETPKKDALSDLDRVVRESDLESPGARKMILNRLDRAEAEGVRLRLVEKEYQDNRVKLAVAAIELSHLKSDDKLQDITLTAAAALLGLSPSFFDKPAFAWPLSAISLGLIGTVWALKLKKKNEA
jgi:hypothetical protein